MRFLDLIAAKRDGRRHGPDELAFVAQAAADGSVPDYQLSAWLMAVYWRGMSPQETTALTLAMARSGEPLRLLGVSAPKVDKHSTGGVGDGVSLALAPLMAAAGLAVPMMSGRGLGHTGGTLDKLEAVPGFRVRLSSEEIAAQVQSVGTAMFGQSERLAPADRRLYALRDATGTVGSLPLIVASILSKKLAEGLDALVLDVKVGSGAIFKDEASAVRLAKALVATAKAAGLRCVAVLTAMEEPLGLYVGNALEVRQALDVLHGDFSASDYVECLLALGGWMLSLGGRAKSAQHGAQSLEKLLRDGSAARKLKEMVRAQGGDERVVDEPSRLPLAPVSRDLRAPRSGFLSRLDARSIGEAAVLLGAGRATMEQPLDYGAGLRLHKKVGQAVDAGEPLATLYAADEGRISEALKRLDGAAGVSLRCPRPAKVVRKVIR